MRMLSALFVTIWPVATVFGQAALHEPPEFPNVFPGPGVLRPGPAACFHLASGRIVPGDVDWMQVTLPRASLNTVVDLDFAPATGAASSILVFVAGGNSAFNSADSNGANDNFCGLGSTSAPLGSTLDSAVSLGPTPRNAVINIGVTGQGDGGFTGLHTRTFNYEVWVYVVPGPCVANSDCYDAVNCTFDACLLPSGACVSTPSDGSCQDGSFCNGAEICSAALGCQPGPPPNCDDGSLCNGAEWCDANLGCRPGTPLVCDDGVFCNGQELCDPAGGCLAGADPCPGMYCRESEARCVECESDADCDDGAFCNGAEWCDAAGSCRSGAPPSCDDGVACTLDSCDASLNACAHTPANALCDDGSVCNGAEWCDANLGCQAGAPLVCDDGAYCNGQESCDPVVGCVAGVGPCHGLYCRENEARCVECQSNADCDDGVGCTVDWCAAVSGVCMHTPSDALCDNGNVCDGQEWCDALLGCQAGAPLVCDDGVYCNGQENCDPTAGCVAGADPCPGRHCRENEARCVECASDADCDDGNYCNGAETCAADGACHAGLPPCASGEVCNAAAGTCEALGLKLDLKPGACPNNFALNSNGFVKGALLGAGGFDLGRVDLTSLRLGRADGLGGPLALVPGQSGAVVPVTGLAAYSTDGCNCSQSGGAATSGRVVTFPASSLAALVQMSHPQQGAVVELMLTGRLVNGTPFTATDCLRIVGAGGH